MGKEGRSSQGLSLSLSSPLQDTGHLWAAPAALLPLLLPLLNSNISLRKSSGCVDFVVAFSAKERSKILLKSQLKSSCLTLVLTLPKETKKDGERAGYFIDPYKYYLMLTAFSG